MRKTRYLIILICYILFCAGCSMNEGAGNDSGAEGTDIVHDGGSSYLEKPVTGQSATAPVQESDSAVPVREDNSLSVDAATTQSSLNQFQGLDEIQYAGGDKVLLFADKIYLYELSGNSVAAESEYPDSGGEYSGLKAWIIDSGYVVAYEAFCEDSETGTNSAYSDSAIFDSTVVGGNGTAGAIHIMFAYYNENLVLQKTVDVTGLGSDITYIHEAAPSMDGSMIAVCEWGVGIALYNAETMEKLKVLSLRGTENAEIGKLHSISQVGFAENDNKIIFLGTCIKDGEGYTCFGSVKTDGSNLCIHKESASDAMSVYPEHAIFSEKAPDELAGGKVWAYYSAQDIFRMMPLTEKRESGHVWGSDKGNYFVTAVREDNVGWTLRLYDVMTAGLVSTKVYEVENIGDYREPHICYLEDAHAAVLLQRPLGDNGLYKAGIVLFQ